MSTFYYLMREMSCYHFVASDFWNEVQATKGYMFHLKIQPFLANDVDDLREKSIKVRID